MIELEGVTKRFPGVAALSEVSFSIQRGTCHALLGENGAGKSTFGKILAGIYRLDGGRVLLDGQPVSFHSPRDATAAGVGIVHQELVFCPNLTVAENLCLHDLPRRGLRLDRSELRRRAASLLHEAGMELDVDLPISKLSIAQEQMLQIAAAVGLGARVLIFDEPTSSLGHEETRRLFALIRRLQVKGVTIVYVSHRLEEIFELCQAVTVLRDGRHMATLAIEQVTRDELVRLMVGRDVAGPSLTEDQPPGRERLRVRGLSSPGKFQDVDLELHAGEILGLAGLVGAGRTEIADALFGNDANAAGEIIIDGRGARLRSPQEAIAHGISLAPEDRKRQGLVLSMNVRENLTLPILHRLRRGLGRVDRRRENELAEVDRRGLNIRAPSIETPVASLSGGNQQKIVMAKSIAAASGILLIDEPTRGIDVGAKREIHELLLNLARQGNAILLISSDLPELLALSHQIAVLRQGKIVARLTREQASPETVLRWMAGIEAVGEG